MQSHFSASMVPMNERMEERDTTSETILCLVRVAGPAHRHETKEPKLSHRNMELVSITPVL